MTKLLKFLVPISTVVAATTPFIASCSCSKDKTYEYDLTKEFKPSIQPIGGSLLETEATKKYLTDANNNKQIFADDLANTFVNLYIKYIGTTYNKLSVIINKIDIDKSLVSLEIYYEMPDVNDPSKLYTSNIKIKNIPVSIKFATMPPIGDLWSVVADLGTDSEYLLENDSWSYYEKTQTEGQEPTTHDWNKQKLIDDPEQKIDIGLITTGISTSLPVLSYYLSETTPA